MPALVDHNYGGSPGSIPPLLATPIIGTTIVKIFNENKKLISQTRTNKRGEWIQSFTLADGKYTIKFSGQFHPVGTAAQSRFIASVTTFDSQIVVPLQKTEVIEEKIVPVVVATDEIARGSLIPTQATQTTSVISPSSRGFRGFRGSKGDKGEQGEVGPQGDPGLIGNDLKIGGDVIIGGDLTVNGTIKGLIDHGSLGGLADDDHPQYAEIAEEEIISGLWTHTSKLIVLNDLVVSQKINAGQTVTFDEFNNGDSGSTATIDWNNSQKHSIVLTAAPVTLTFVNPVGVGNFLIRLIQDSAGSRTITWPSNMNWPSGSAPELSTAADAIDVITLYYDKNRYYGVFSLNFS